MRYVKAYELVSYRTGKLDSNAAEAGGQFPFFTCAQATYRINRYAFDTECVLLAGNNAGGIFPLKYFKGKFNAYQRTYVIEPRQRDKLDIKYFYYFLRPYLKAFEQQATGATTKFLTLKILNGIDVVLPDIDTQKKIAAILSAYDDLIENNRRRIALLEKMADEIYREWFVRLRFPGHEQAKFEKGVPVGWTASTLGRIATFTMGQSPSSEFYNETGDGQPFHQGVGTYGDRFPVTTTFCSVEGRRAKAGDLLFSVRAPVGRINIADRDMIIGRGLAAIRDKAKCNSYLYYLLKVAFSSEDIIGNGSIFNSVGKDELARFPIYEPPPVLVSKFEGIASTIDQQIESLMHAVTTLQRSRDALLPRLISGKLPVDALDIRFPSSMQLE
jgi:type I restriction enzyme, S subunit